MSVEDHDSNLADQYVLARRWRPDLDAPELARLILSRLSEEQVQRCARDAGPWVQQPADRQELALRYVQNFVLAMETDPDDPD